MKPIEVISIPHENVNDEFVTITDLYFKNGDEVKAGQSILSFDSSKADITIECTSDGYIKYLCNERDEIKVGEVIAEIYETVFDNILIVNKEYDYKNKYEPFITKKAKELISENNLNAEDFLDYEIINEDVVSTYLQNKRRVITKEGNKTVEATLEKIKARKEKISIKKKREIEYLSYVHSSGLVSNLTIFIEQRNIKEKINSKLNVLKNSILPIIIYEVSRLLKKYPLLNAYYNSENIYFYDDINVGIAIEFDYGLKVATIYNSNKKDIYELENEVIEKTEKYFDNKLTAEDLQNSTFTISDLFNEDISFFTPLVNKKQSAILAVGSIDKSLGGFNLTLAYDHRVLTGKYAAKFMVELKNRIVSYSIGDNSEKDNVKKHCDICYASLKEDKKYDGIGLVKVQTIDGEKYICIRCLSGWK